MISSIVNSRQQVKIAPKLQQKASVDIPGHLSLVH
jgi:hypothetical protein